MPEWDKVVSVPVKRRTIALTSAAVRVSMRTTTAHVSAGPLSGVPMLQTAVVETAPHIGSRLPLPRVALPVHVPFVGRPDTQVVPTPTVGLLPRPSAWVAVKPGVNPTTFYSKKAIYSMRTVRFA